MPASTIALTGARIFDGQDLLSGMALLVAPDGAVTVRPQAQVSKLETRALAGGILMPGFVDLQVNGGGGVMFNDDPCVATLRTIAQAHASEGTRGLLPTLITDTKAKTAAAIAAVSEAIAASVPGIVGLHLEGPHLDVSRKGAHDAAHIRPMEDADLAQLCTAAHALPTLMVTLSPDAVSDAQIKQLVAAGAVVSLGHSDCSYERAMQAFDAGASMVTHLFNAMSQLGGRTPGLVGAALSHGAVHAGLIADGIHVHAASMRTALNANIDGIFLVSDAMAPAGSQITSFELGGRRITRRDGRLTLADGTLAGADLTLARAVQVLTTQVGVPLARALAMATCHPAGVLRAPGALGGLAGGTGGVIHFDPETLAVAPLAQLLG